MLYWLDWSITNWPTLLGVLLAETLTWIVYAELIRLSVVIPITVGVLVSSVRVILAAYGSVKQLVNALRPPWFLVLLFIAFDVTLGVEVYQMLGSVIYSVQSCCVKWENDNWVLVWPDFRSIIMCLVTAALIQIFYFMFYWLDWPITFYLAVALSWLFCSERISRSFWIQRSNFLGNELVSCVQVLDKSCFLSCAACDFAHDVLLHISTGELLHGVLCALIVCNPGMLPPSFPRQQVYPMRLKNMTQRQSVDAKTAKFFGNQVKTSKQEVCV